MCVKVLSNLLLFFSKTIFTFKLFQRHLNEQIIENGRKSLWTDSPSCKTWDRKYRQTVLRFLTDGRRNRRRCAGYRQLKRQENVSINGRDFIASDSASGTVDDAERRQMTKLLFNQLPKATRRILYLRNVEGMTLGDIATICNRPKTSIKSSISAARKQIIDQLKRQRWHRRIFKTKRNAWF